MTVIFEILFCLYYFVVRNKPGMKTISLIAKRIQLVIVSFVFIILAVYLVLLIYCKISAGRVINFNAPSNINSDYSNLFKLLLELDTWSLLIFIFCLPFFIFLSVLRNDAEKSRYLNTAGFIAFILLGILFFTDPFGIWQYLND